MPLTDLQAKKAAPHEKPYKRVDEKGMYLLVKDAGKYWRLDYRFAGKRKTLAIGVYPEVSLAEARELRDEARNQIAMGVDPCAERKATKQAEKSAIANTVEAVARRWWNDHAPTWSTAYSARIMTRLEADVFPIIGAVDIEALTPAHLREMTDHCKTPDPL